ncbi:MAG: hypothetical protein FJ253_09090, partial [Phycisphaerae bacterium]|nr:hypothetical protein [Phycisphaerae bacterium]
MLAAALGAAPVAPQSSAASSAQSQGPTSQVDPGWPRSFSKNGTTLVLHQPQVDAWKDHDQIKFRCVVEV